MSARRHRSSAALAALVLLALAPAAGAAPAGARAKHPKAISARTLEERYGLRVSRVAVVAGGGVVDLRLRVVDPEKARALLADHRPPRLLVGPKRIALDPPAHAPGLHALERSKAGYVLFANTGDVVKRGATVAVALGELRVEPVPVE